MHLGGGSTTKDSDSLAWTGSATATTSTRRAPASSTLTTSPTPGRSGDTISEDGRMTEEVKLAEAVDFKIEAGDGLTDGDAADLTFILRKVS